MKFASGRLLVATFVLFCLLCARQSAVGLEITSAELRVSVSQRVPPRGVQRSHSSSDYPGSGPGPFIFSGSAYSESEHIYGPSGTTFNGHSSATAGGFATAQQSGRVISGAVSSTLSVNYSGPAAANPYWEGDADLQIYFQTGLGGVVSNSSDGDVFWEYTVPPGAGGMGAGAVFPSTYPGHAGATQFVEYDPRAILRNSSLTPQISGSVITATFSPVNPDGYPVALHDLAVALGYDHFNILQTVDHFPASWSQESIWLDVDMDTQGGRTIVDAYYNEVDGFWRRLTNNSPIVAYPAPEHMLDTYPVEASGREGTFFYKGADGFTVPWDIDPLVTLLDRDDLPFYYGATDLAELAVDDGYRLFFHDKPVQPLGAMLTTDAEHRSDEALAFTTKLVGVKFDQNGKQTYEETGVQMTWKSDAQGGLGGVFGGQGGVFLGAETATPVSGGVFDVVVSVPEPASLSAFALGGIGLLVVARTGTARRRGTTD